MEQEAEALLRRLQRLRVGVGVHPLRELDAVGLDPFGEEPLGQSVGAAISGLVAGRFAISVEKGPRISDGQRLVLALVGGIVAGIGAKIARGCTSGQALTGASVLNAGSLVFMLAVFVAGYTVAWMARKEWL